MISIEWKKLIKEHWYTLLNVIKWTAIQQEKEGVAYDIYLTKDNEILVIENGDGDVVPNEAKTGDALLITSILPDSGLFDVDIDTIKGQKLLDILSQYGLKDSYIQDFQTWVESNGYDEPTLDLLYEYDPIIYGGIFDYIATQLTNEEEIEELLDTAVSQLTEAKQLLPTDIEKGSLKKILGYAETTQEWISLIEEKREELQDAILEAASNSYETGLVNTVYLFADGDIIISEDIGGSTTAGEVYTGDAIKIATFDNDPTVISDELDRMVGEDAIGFMRDYGMSLPEIKEFYEWYHEEYDDDDPPSVFYLSEYDPDLYEKMFLDTITEYVRDIDPDEYIDEVIESLETELGENFKVQVIKEINRLLEKQVYLPTDIEKGSLKKILGYADSTNLADVQTDEMIKRAKSQINSGKVSYQEMIRKLNWQAVMNKTNAPQFSKKLNQVMDALQDWHEKSR